jgi:hypothetical protein
MTTLLGALTALTGIGLFICAIIVLIQLFKVKGAGHGILGILCGLYPFIWGWINATTLNLKKVMLAWTILLIVFLVLEGVLMAAIAKAAIDAQPPTGTEMTSPSGN